jgi:aminopeptidase N
MIFNHFQESVTIQDRVSALVMLNRSSSPKRHEILSDMYEQWHHHLSAYANYLRIIASGTCSDVFDMIRYEKDRPSFDPRQPTWCRALFLPMAANNKKLWTLEGLEWLEQTVMELSTINHITAGRLLNALQHYRNLKPDLQSMVKPVLERIREKISAEINPALHGQASAYLGR